MSKKLLEESTIRQFMKLAELSPLSENFLEEKRRKKKGMREENLEEENLDEEVVNEENLDEMKGDQLEEDDAGVVASPSTDPGKNLEEEKLEEELDALLEDELNEMGDMYEEDEDMEMEAEAGDMEAEINITPDQARAIIAVADMLKDIMPDLDAPEMEDEEEMDMDMDKADDDMADAEKDMGDADEDEDKADKEEDDALEMAENNTLEENDELAEAIMKKVKARLKEMKSK